MPERPTQSSRFNLVQIDSESILYDNESHNVIYLDSPGSIVWALCDGLRNIGEISQLIAEAYPESRDAIAIDVKTTIDQLVEQGALSFK